MTYLESKPDILFPRNGFRKLIILLVVVPSPIQSDRPFWPADSVTSGPHLGNIYFLPSGPCVPILVYLGLDHWAIGSCDVEQCALTLIQSEAGSSGGSSSARHSDHHRKWWQKVFLKTGPNGNTNHSQESCLHWLQLHSRILTKPVSHYQWSCDGKIQTDLLLQPPFYCLRELPKRIIMHFLSISFKFYIFTT